MKDLISNNSKYISLILVLSFLALHNIFLVLIGIFISLCDLNNIDIYNMKRFSSLNDDKIDLIKTNKSIEKESKKLYLNLKHERLTLVESIEELGYIPSMNKEKNRN